MSGLELPDDVVHEFALTGQVKVVAGGKINTTLLANRQNGPSIILQKLSETKKQRSFVDLAVDYAVVQKHLEAHDWEIPKPVKTISGEDLFVDASENLWRGFELLDNDEPSTEDYYLYGKLLGKLHLDLAKLDYTPQYVIDHFHDTVYYASELELVLPEMSEGAELAVGLLGSHKALGALPEVKTQLLHGDPKIANMLHKGGEPYSFIDWESTFLGIPWIDLGDLIRSVAVNELRYSGSLNVNQIRQVIKGYYSVNTLGLEESEFTSGAISAGQQLTVELAMRYMADYDDEEGHFAWDDNNYKSRHHNNVVRAEELIKVNHELHNLEKNIASEKSVVRVDVDDTLLDSGLFKDSLFGAISELCDYTKEELADQAKSNFYMDEVLGGYLISEHLASLGIDGHDFLARLPELISKEMLIDGAEELLNLSQDDQIDFGLLSYGDESLQRPKIETILRLLGKSDIHFDITSKRKTTYFKESYPGRRGVLVDNIPAQELPEGVHEITFDKNQVFEDSGRAETTIVRSLAEATRALISFLDNVD